MLLTLPDSSAANHSAIARPRLAPRTVASAVSHAHSGIGQRLEKAYRADPQQGDFPTLSN